MNFDDRLPTIDVVLRRDLIASGFDDKAIRRMVLANELHRIRRGAFIDGQTWASLDDLGRHRALARAVLRTAHPEAVLTHQSACAEYAVPLWDVDLSEAHVTRPDQRSGRREAGVARHHGSLAEEHIVERNGVRVTTAARAAIELTTVTHVESSLVTVNALLHGGHTTPEELREVASFARHWPHSLRTDLILRLADGRLESAGETRLDHLCWRQGILRPQPQYEVFDEYGGLIGRVDFAWPELGVFMEFDGMNKYLQLRRDGESVEDVVLREKRREELICAVTGWVCIRITWADLARPQQTARRIKAILASRSGRVA